MSEYSIFGPTGLGLHIVVNPLTKPKAERKLNGDAILPPDRQVSNAYRNNGIRLNERELHALRTSRESAVKTISDMLGRPGPYATLPPENRLSLALKLVDLLLEQSVQAQLSKESPTALQSMDSQSDKLDALLSVDSAPSLLKQLPIGVSVKVHFPVDWL